MSSGTTIEAASFQVSIHLNEMSSLAAAQAQAVSPAVKEMRFHHIQLYADELQPLAHYKALEAEMCSFVSRSGFSSSREALQGASLETQISTGVKAWAEMKGISEASARAAGGDGYVCALAKLSPWRPRPRWHSHSPDRTGPHRSRVTLYRTVVPPSPRWR